VSYTDLQRGPEAFNAFFEDLAGGQPEEGLTEETKATKPTREPRAPKTEPSAKEPEALTDDEDANESETDLETPVLPIENEEPEGEETEDEDADDDKNGIQTKLFKLREDKRQLKSSVADLQKENEQLASKLKAALASSPEAHTSEFTGAYTHVKTEADVDYVANWLEQRLSVLENFIDSEEPSFLEQENDQEVERTRAWARAQVRAITREQGRADTVRKTLTTQQQQQAEATRIAEKRYPFVLDAKSPYNDVTLEMAQEFPELARSPKKALALGRMTVAKLVESGRFKLVPVPAKGAATSQPAPSAKTVVSVPAVPQRRSAPAPVRQEATTQTDQARQALINGDPRALTEWAAGLVG
jgi:hypothetical protein